MSVLDLTAPAGVGLDQTFTYYKADGTVYDLTGWTASLKIVGDHGATPRLTLANGNGITLGGVAGTVRVVISPAQATALNVLGHYHLYECVLTPNAGVTGVSLLNGVLATRLQP